MKRSISVAAAAAACLTPGTAHAEFGAPIILTRGVNAQAGGGAPAVSADGRYVVFRTSANIFKDNATAAAKGLTGSGLVRQTLSTGELDVVGSNAGAPSVSSDGRYVVFTTVAPLVPSDENGVTDIYRRDMNLSVGDPNAFVLVSRGTGRDEPLRYGPIGSSAALTPGAQTLSADGNRVIFSIQATSNALAPDSANLDTTFGAIVVRDIAAESSTVMNVDRLGNIEDFPDSPRAGRSAPSLTSDGSVALWTVSSISRYIGRFDPFVDHLVERRVDAPQSPIRVVFGPTDPEDPACGAKGAPTPDVVAGPCDGVSYSAGSIFGWAANADGSKVVVSGKSRAAALAQGDQADLFVVDMARSGSRKAATRRLTAGATLQTSSETGPALAMSGDGRRVVFTAKRWAANLTPPVPVGAFLPGNEQLQPYLVDLGTDTLRLLAAGYDGKPFDLEIKSVSVSGDGATVAMDTAATNLFYGDTNEDLDAILLRDLPPLNPSPLSVAGTPVSAPADPQPGAKLEVVVNPTTLGGVTARVTAPWSGKVTVDVRKRASVVRSAKRKSKVQPRILEPVAADITSLSTRSFSLSPRRRYLADLRRERGIPALVTVTLAGAGAGRPTLTRSIPVTLRRAIVKAKEARR